jgi:TetR/AcrR family tetracycline transcriptional repressor
MSSRGPGQRAGLTRVTVLDAARELLASEGLAGLTMRALARRLGVAPNAVYSYVPTKDDLVDALLDDLLAAVEIPPADVTDPVAGIATIIRSSYEVLVTRPDLVPVALARQGSRGPNAVALGVVTDALLARAGVPADAVPTARRALIVHAIGAAAFAAGAAGDNPVPAQTTRADFDRSLAWLLEGMTRAGA